MMCVGPNEAGRRARDREDATTLPTGLLDRLLAVGRSVARSATPGGLRSVLQPIAAQHSLRRALAGLSPPEKTAVPGPLVVSGLLAESKGVSEGARLTLAALQAAGFPTIPHDLRPLFRRDPGAGLPTDRPGGVWLMHINAPEAVAALAALDAQDWRGRYRIGYWAYELPVAPALWVKAARLFQEIWVPSRFVADALTAAGVSVPVRVMPHPVSLGPAPPRRNRGRFGLPGAGLVVLAMGDLLSSPTRKNLAGAIEIYCRAFPEPGATRLVVKTHSDTAHPRFAVEMARASGSREDIVFMARDTSREEIAGLIAASDVVLSPHRSEGFGLTLAEGFLSGAPALATGWSGNLEFMSGIPELLIAHRMSQVRDPFGVYGNPRLAWAEPDLADAVSRLTNSCGVKQPSEGLGGERCGRGPRTCRRLVARRAECDGARPTGRLTGSQQVRWVPASEPRE